MKKDVQKLQQNVLKNFTNFSDLTITMRNIFLCVFCLLIVRCQALKRTFKIASTTLWEIQFPENFKEIDTKTWNQERKAGKQVMDNFAPKMFRNNSKLLFIIEKGSLNRLEANSMAIQDFIAPNSHFTSSLSEINTFSYVVFKNKAPEASIDSLTCIEKIGGLDFYCFKMQTHLDENLTMYTWNLKRIFKDEIVSINLNYIDPKIGNEYILALKKCTFKHC